MPKKQAISNSALGIPRNQKQNKNDSRNSLILFLGNSNLEKFEQEKF
jgi:hypothetical protein